MHQLAAPEQLWRHDAHQHVSRWFAYDDSLRADGTLRDRVVLGSRSGVPRQGADASATTKLRGNFGRGVKEPTMRQSFSLSSFDLGNPDLKAGASRTFDAGIEQRLLQRPRQGRSRLVRQPLREPDLHAHAQLLALSGPVLQRGPDARARHRDSSSRSCRRLRPAPAGRATRSLDSEIVDASSEFSEVLASGNGRSGGRATRARCEALWERGALFDSMLRARSSAGATTATSRRLRRPRINSAGGYWLWRAQATASHVRCDAYVRVENLTDKDYMEPLGYPAWRRTVHA